jgi:hypothetical protein
VTRARAIELSEKYAESTVRAKLNVFDWLMEKQDKRVAKSPAGYLVKSIMDDYAPPRGFESTETRQKQVDASRDAEELATEVLREKQEQAVRERSERIAAEAYWNSLTPEQQAALDEAAISSASPEVLEIQNGPLKKMAKVVLRFDYIRGILREQASVLVNQGTSNFRHRETSTDF